MCRAGSTRTHAVPRGRGERQDRINPVERLNRRFLIDAEDDGALRRIEVEPDHVRGFRLEVGIGRAHISPGPDARRPHARGAIDHGARAPLVAQASTRVESMACAIICFTSRAYSPLVSPFAKSPTFELTRSAQRAGDVHLSLATPT